MECYFCGSTACPAIASNERSDCLHCSDKAIEQERGIIAYCDGKGCPDNESQAFREGWHDAHDAYSNSPSP